MATESYWKELPLKLMLWYFPMNTAWQCHQLLCKSCQRKKMSAMKREGALVRCGRGCALLPPPLSTAGASSCSCQIPPHNQQVSCGESAKEWCGVRERCRLGGRGIPCSWRVIWEKDNAARVWPLCWSGIGYWDILQKVQKRKRIKYERGNHLPQHWGLEGRHPSLS